MDRFWNWQKDTWPEFKWTKDVAEKEVLFYQNVGYMTGVIQTVSDADLQKIRLDILSNEAIKTSEIEGEVLDRDSVQESLKRQFGLVENLGKRVKHAEEGVSKLMLDVYRTYASKLSHQTLFRWHKALFLGEKKISIGAYRTHKEPMQIVSGNLVRPTVHFQAPPSKDVPYEMDRFITWFNATHPDGKQPLPCLIRASIAHLYFEAIHPFEDGNGRIGRALIKKVISQHTKSPTLLSLSHLIYKQSKQYYRQLELHNQTLNVDGWIEFFSNLIVDAQKNTIALMEFVIYKSKVFLEFGFQLNERQVKVLHRLFEAGPEGFKGGLSAKNYRSISKASPATVTRDLRELVALGILYSKGEKKMTRYYFKR